MLLNRREMLLATGNACVLSLLPSVAFANQVRPKNKFEEIEESLGVDLSEKGIYLVCISEGKIGNDEVGLHNYFNAKYTKERVKSSIVLPQTKPIKERRFGERAKHLAWEARQFALLSHVEKKIIVQLVQVSRISTTMMPTIGISFCATAIISFKDGNYTFHKNRYGKVSRREE